MRAEYQYRGTEDEQVMVRRQIKAWLRRTFYFPGEGALLLSDGACLCRKCTYENWRALVQDSLQRQNGYNLRGTGWTPVVVYSMYEQDYCERCDHCNEMIEADHCEHESEECPQFREA